MTYSPSGSGGAGRISTASDVTLSTLTDKQFLMYNASTQKWVNHTLAPADVSGLQTYVNNLITTSGSGTGGGTTASVPGAPTSTAVTVTSTTATITWAPPTNTGGSTITGYTVSRDGTDSNGTGTYTDTGVGASTRTYTFSNLVFGQTYHLTVAATNSTGTGSVATVSAAPTNGASNGGGTGVSLPSAPGNVAASVSGTTAVLTWTAPSSSGSSAITGYTVARDGTDSVGTVGWTDSTTASTLTYTFLNLVAGSTYHLTVQAVSAAGTGATGTATAAITSSSGGTGTGSGSGSGNASTNPRIAAFSLPTRGWYSGGSGDGIDSNNPAFGNWRGSPVDMISTWNDTANGGGWNIGCMSSGGGGPIAGFAGLADIAIGGPTDFSAAASGSLDSALTSGLTNLRANRTIGGVVRPTIIRPCHELNGNWYGWAVNTSNLSSFKATMQRWRAIKNTAFPEALWTICYNGENSGTNANISDMWLSDGTFDLIGVDRYNSYPVIGPALDGTNTTWQSGSTLGNQTNPIGIQTWLQFAATRGVPLYLPEYANRSNGDGSDNNNVTHDPYWINNFFPWVKTNAGSGPGKILGESWFNQSTFGPNNYGIYNGSVVTPYAPDVANAYKAYFTANGNSH